MVEVLVSVRHHPLTDGSEPAKSIQFHFGDKWRGSLFRAVSTSRSMRAAIFILLAGCMMTIANPRMLPLHGDYRLFMSSEDLTVRLSPDSAKIAGTFRFKHRQDVEQPEAARPAVLQIPIWFPERDDQNPLVAKFWRMFPKEAHEGKLNSRNKALFKRMVDLHAWLGDRLLKITRFDVLTYQQGQKYAPMEWNQEVGWCCLVFQFEFDIDSTLVKQPLRVSYSQPLLHKGEEARFFYLPVLKNLPVITDVESYHIMVIAEKGCSLEISNGDAQAVVEEGLSARLTPQHHVPIRAVVQCRADPQGGATGSQPLTSVTNRTSAAPGSHRSP